MNPSQPEYNPAAARAEQTPLLASPEQVPERPPEAGSETAAGRAEETRHAQETAAAMPSVRPDGPVRQGQVYKTARHSAVERFLEAGLKDLFLAMPAEARRRFLGAGEQLAAELGALDPVRARPHEVRERIGAWLELIPGVEPGYALQASFIKTKQILSQRPDKPN
jgi:hypothetical protein